tara:strand:- start:104 stop:940 length:837 start_codon:yes stop_codon:yes gene_type:complete
MTVLSIQSSVSFGYVGNSVAIPTLQKLGHDCWYIHTVYFSNHPGHEQFSGEFATPKSINEKIQSISEIRGLDNCTAVLSGYLGLPSNAEVVASTVDHVKKLDDSSLYILDPVIGDDGKIFVKKGIRSSIRDILLPRADFIIPNVSELSWLSGQDVNDYSAMIAAAHQLLKNGPKTVFVTGRVEDLQIANYAISEQGVWRAAGPLINQKFNGTGDFFSALVTGLLLNGYKIDDLLSVATAACELITSETQKRRTKELAVITTLKKIAINEISTHVEKIA